MKANNWSVRACVAELGKNIEYQIKMISENLTENITNKVFVNFPKIFDQHLVDSRQYASDLITINA